MGQFRKDFQPSNDHYRMLSKEKLVRKCSIPVVNPAISVLNSLYKLKMLLLSKILLIKFEHNSPFPPHYHFSQIIKNLLKDSQIWRMFRTTTCSVVSVPLDRSKGLFMVPKPNRGILLILDLKSLNKYLQIPKCFNCIYKISDCLAETRWILGTCRHPRWQSSYFHLSSSSALLHFGIGDYSFQFFALPFSLSSTTRVFTKVPLQALPALHRL